MENNTYCLLQYFIPNQYLLQYLRRLHYHNVAILATLLHLSLTTCSVIYDCFFNFLIIQHEVKDTNISYTSSNFYCYISSCYIRIPLRIFDIN